MLFQFRPAPGRRAENMGRARLRFGARIERPLGETAKRQHAVIKDNCTGDAKIYRETGRDSNDMIAAFDQGRRQRAALGAEHIGGIEWMGKTRQLDRIIHQFDAD